MSCSGGDAVFNEAYVVCCERCWMHWSLNLSEVGIGHGYKSADIRNWFMQFLSHTGHGQGRQLATHLAMNGVGHAMTWMMERPTVLSPVGFVLRAPRTLSSHSFFSEHYLVGGLERFLFFHMVGIIIPSVSRWLMFFRGVETTNQPFFLRLFAAFIWRIQKTRAFSDSEDARLFVWKWRGTLGFSSLDTERMWVCMAQTCFRWLQYIIAFSACLWNAMCWSPRCCNLVVCFAMHLTILYIYIYIGISSAYFTQDICKIDNPPKNVSFQ